SGVMMSPTSELTMPVKAAPIMTPTARSTTLPRRANFLNSCNMTFNRSVGALPVPGGPKDAASVEQAGVHHRLAHRGLRLLACRHHRQPHRIGALADQRHRVLDRRRAGLDEQVDVQRGELVLQLEGGGEITLEARALEFRAQARRHV